MPQHEALIGQFQATLDQSASASTREWWEKYMRGVISFRGVGIPEIRKQLAVWRQEQGIAAWSNEEQMALALLFFESPLAEDKLTGVLFFQDYLYDAIDWQTLLPHFEALYQRNLIFDWNTCDWFCVRVLGPMIAKYGPGCAQAIAAWKQAEHLWQARSAVVAFVPVVKQRDYDALIYETCETLIQREERFGKTAVGWILRDLSKQDPEGVRTFVETQIRHFSPEALKNALKYFDPAVQKQYLQQRKTA